jgi:hypothetical protein
VRPGGGLRIALLGGDTGTYGELATGLAALGHTVVAPGAVAGGTGAWLEAGLGRRGFTDSLTTVPSTLRVLERGDYDVAHAFAPAAAYAALLWRRRRHPRLAVVFTSTEILHRDRLADRRRRLTTMAAAVERSDAVTVTTPVAQASLLRWMATDAELIAATDAAGHAALYARLLASPE